MGGHVLPLHLGGLDATGRGRERGGEGKGGEGRGGEALAVEPSHFSTGSDATGTDIMLSTNGVILYTNILYSSNEQRD